MNNGRKLKLGILYEVLWFAVALAIAYVFILPVKQQISQPFFVYLFCSLFLAVTYFRFTAFMMRSVILEHIWVKIGLLILNIPLFFFVLNQYFNFIEVFNDYNFTLAANIFQHIKSGTEVDELMYLRQLTVFSGIISMLLIVLLECRLIYAIFKLRQLDKYL